MGGCGAGGGQARKGCEAKNRTDVSVVTWTEMRTRNGIYTTRLNRPPSSLSESIE